MPLHNVEETLIKLIRRPLELVDEYSSDRTVKIAKEMDIKTFIHRQNGSYGANQKP